MQSYNKYIFFFYITLNVLFVFGQGNSTLLNQSQKFTVRGSVIESDTREPIQNVNIEVNGGAYTTTDVFGEFRIQVSRGDELTIRHKDFETVFYTIQSDERIKVEVEPSEEESFKNSKLKSYSKSQSELFKPLIDSAGVYLKKDAKKSIQFIEDALVESKSTKQNGKAYEVLGDVFMYWKQYDLAASNYRISLQNTDANTVQLKLAQAYKLNKNYQESLEIYNSISKSNLSNWQLTQLHEGLGNVFLLIKEYQKAVDAYQEGLVIANKHLITPKITDLNSKIAQAYNAKGDANNAELYFKASMQLANTENKKRAVEEKVKVADFQSEVNNFSNEIELRKEVLNELEDIAKDSVFDNESVLTPQKQNYKIGRAYASQSDFGNAIPYLQKSIEEADRKADFLVQKDATRKLSEVFRDAGQFDKALLAYQEYVDLVDKLYLIKEQEISQATRFSKDIVNKQNRISSLESDRALSESKYELTIEQSKRQKLIIYSLIGGVLLLLLTAIYKLSNEGFNLYTAEEEDVAGGFEHSGNFALIDKNGFLRSRKDDFGNPIIYYRGIVSEEEKVDEDGVQEEISTLKEDIKKLLKE